MSSSDDLAAFVAAYPADWSIAKWSGPNSFETSVPISATLPLSEYTRLVLSVGPSRVEVEVYGRGGIMPFHGIWAEAHYGSDLMSRIGRRVADVVQNAYRPSLFDLPEWLRPPVREVLLARAALLKAVAEES